VFGEGPEDAKWMFLGEGPGQNEDIQAKPFVGRSGALLNRLLYDIGWSRQQVYITNVVQCRPPENRDPEQDEVEACRPFLIKKIEAIKPIVITTLGRHAASLLLGRPVKMGEVRGKIVNFGDSLVVPTYHPSFVLRGNSAAQKVMLEDMILAISLLAERGH
jgi:DNA polymerase